MIAPTAPTPLSDVVRAAGGYTLGIGARWA